MIVLARAVAERGHDVSVLSLADSESAVRRAGVRFVPFGERHLPVGEWARRTQALGRLHGDAGSRVTLVMLGAQAHAILDDLPDVLPRLGLDGLVMDQVCAGAESVAALLRLPLAVACNALPVHREPSVPTYNRAWRYRDAWWARLRNRAGNAHVIVAARDILRAVIRFRRVHRLPLLGLRDFNEVPPSLVHVTQIPAFFDFPRRALPDHVHYTAPWHRPPDTDTDAGFPWTQLDERPLIYASMGTMQNRVDDVFHAIAAACASLDVNLVIGLGRREPLMQSLPGSPIVVEYAPQLALLRRAALVITHGGLNTALETLQAGVPMVCLPITNDQPGVAERLRHLGVAEVLPLQRLTAHDVRARVQRVLQQPSFRQHAEAAARRLREMDGPAVAARLIEDALCGRQRVTRVRMK
jgi:zeaxanthin glucosyltransferase